MKTRWLTACLLMMLVVNAFAQPWTPQVIWDRSGVTPTSWYGANVFALGDQNGDGFADWGVVTQPTSDPYVEFFYGGNPPSTLPCRTLRADTAQGERLLWANSVGDLNGDQRAEWMTQTRNMAQANVWIWSIFFGGIADTVPDLILRLRAGDQLYPMGDFNGDGYDDLYRYCVGDSGVVYYGGTDMDTLPDWTLHSPVESYQESWPDGYGDLNGDGYSDFASAVSHWPSYSLWIFHGGANPDTIPTTTWTNYTDYPTRVVKDLNGDGRDEIVSVTQSQSHVNVYLGAETMQHAPDFVLNIPNGCMATDLVSAGDVNGDGYNDLLLVDMDCANGWGMISLYLGGAALNPNPAWTAYGRTPPLNMVGIIEAEGLGDVNGNGIADFAVGAFNGDTDGQRGRVIVLSDTGHVSNGAERRPVADNLRVSVYPNPLNGEAVILLDMPSFTSNVTLTVFNLMGQAVQAMVLHDAAGTVHQRLDASALSSGVYVLRVNVGLLQTTQKLVVLK